jgi:hypothetical protein
MSQDDMEFAVICLLLLVVTCFTVRLLNTRHLDSKTLRMDFWKDEPRIDSTWKGPVRPI